jgi:hypothetical protein
MWLYIINKIGSQSCASNKLEIFLYMTSLKKELPKSENIILEQTHVNTAYTTVCPKDSEIIIYRKEEWFKVFIHETFHNFGLDFSDMNNNNLHRCILDIFDVKSEVNLYESYTEFWAEIMNSIFCSYYIMKNKRDFNEFISNFDFFINFERTYAFFQMVKALDFMKLTYEDIIKQSSPIVSLYKEETSVLSYYVIRSILLNNYQGFLQWCKKNNEGSLIQFNKTPFHLESFYKFIEDNYKKKTMLEGVSQLEKVYSSVKHKKGHEYVSNNMRMTLSELC